MQPVPGQDEGLSRADSLLLEFLQDNEARCPICGYNLKALTRPLCPECGQPLVLTVGAARLRLDLLLAALAPGFFSGIAALFVFALIVAHLIAIGSTWPIIVAVDSFGWLSGIFAIVLARKRVVFLSRPRATQWWWVAGIWAIHVAALLGFIALGRAL